ncbi:LysR family transcriptional regulator [Paraburkholderia sp. ZP32-5]|uniref:LysR family transcriptional regulator n=1 Tax=Paraburkholderia sp. ZP32-5 TaxID=2883245 RepID=UPI001F2847B8|nr:LysR family transcriptional regulator [Paraburkholderia sp. ZP32-5]
MHNLDLKSLMVFSTLLKECNVTRAAEQLNMTQSAVSHTLARLREIFRDPLFVPMGRGITPTPRALELAEPLQHALRAMDVLVQPAAAFNPKDFVGTFHIATTDYIGFILLPLLVKRLEEVAPGVEMNIRPLKPHDDLELLKSGELDLILWNEGTAPDNYYVQKLFSDRLKSIVRVGHPAINGSLSLEQFRAGRHLRVNSSYGAVKEAIDQHYEGASAKMAVTIPHFLLAHILVSQTNLIGMIAELTAQRIVGEIPLQVLEPPVDMKPFTVSQVWHARRNSSPSHRWVRGEIVAIASEIRSTQQTP